jgi:hypothetical protein
VGCPAVLALAAVLLLAGAVPARAATWTVGLSAASSGSAAAGTLGTAAAPTTACGSTGKTVTVSWAAVANAGGYTVLQATAAGGPYSNAATGVSGTSWTSAPLSNNTYWFEVRATEGSWSGAPSSAGAGRTIQGNSCS